MIWLLFQCLIIFSAAQTPDYTQEHIESCIDLQYSDSLRNIFILHSYDSLLIQILFPISLLCNAGTIFTYYRVPQTRQQPGDILLALAVSQTFMLASYLSTSIYNSVHPLSGPVPSDFDTFCQITGYFYSLSFCTEFIYNLCFSGYFIVKIRNPLKGVKLSKFLVHIFCILVVAVTGVILFLTNSVGISLTGICGLKISPISPFLRTILTTAYLAILLATTFAFRRYLRISYNRHGQEYYKYYYSYIIVVSVNLLLEAVFTLVSGINCFTKQPDYSLEVFITLSNVCVIINPILIFGVILMHPNVKKPILRLLRGWFNWTKQRPESNNIQMHGMGAGFVDNLISHNRSGLIYTILFGLMAEQDLVEPLKNIRYASEWNFSDMLNIQLSGQLLSKYEDSFIPSLKLLDLQMTSYCPRIFKSLKKMDGFSDIRRQLDPRLNEQLIRKESKVDGGRSGEFFFFNHDHKLILKTLSTQELGVITQKIRSYAEYLNQHPHSLIVKFFGIYTFTNTATNQQYHIFMMKNLAACDRKHIIRAYDLKGSRFDRQVLKDKEYENVQEVIGKTLKDIDFMTLEKKLNVSTKDTIILRSILTDDSRFFEREGLIDYSLMVLKIETAAYLFDSRDGQSLTKEDFTSRLPNPYQVVYSSTQPGVAYVLGIIDYLETWNSKKKGQKVLKRLFFWNSKSDEISAQSPRVYATRFIHNLVDQIL